MSGRVCKLAQSPEVDVRRTHTPEVETRDLYAAAVVAFYVGLPALTKVLSCLFKPVIRISVVGA